MAEDLIRVRDIDWTDNNINRAGITPIYYDGSFRWIGVGITNYSASLITIGGSYEKGDHDLLSTAIREYREEVKENLDIIDDEDLYNCYAVKTNYTIQILLPVSYIPEKFKKTKELVDILWVTPYQLEIIVLNAHYNIIGKTKGFRMSRFSPQIFNKIARVMKTSIPFNIIDIKDEFIRNPRINKIFIPRIKTDLKHLEYDIHIMTTSIPGSLFIILSNNIIGITREDKTIYLLPSDYHTIRSVLDIIARSKINIFVPTRLDKNYLSAINNKLIIDSLEERSKIRIVLPLFNNFLWDLKFIKNNSDTSSEEIILIKQLNIIREYEEKIYKIIRKENKTFNYTRYSFLNGINIVNTFLNNTNGMEYEDIIWELLDENNFHSKISSSNSLNIIKRLNLVLFDIHADLIILL